ncbi:MAG: hypothetical protein ACNA8L_12295 [Luteolibacter sp.]
MKTQPHNFRHPRGYISYVLVVTTSVVMTLLMLYAYRASIDAQAVQGEVQLYIDYSEKEETILRSIVALTPNRAIRAMQRGANENSSKRDPLRWQNIFQESVVMANAHSSVSGDLLQAIQGEGHRVLANVGDSQLTDTSRIFRAIQGTGWVTPGTATDFGTGYPVSLNVDNFTDRDRDAVYPIISQSKHYGNLAADRVGAAVQDYPQFNLLQYPEINFGYARPGEPFVAKHNWWAFTIDLAGHDQSATGVARNRREMILSIYEIPSQLAISTSAFVNFGEHASGERWKNVNIEGNVFAGRAQVADEMTLAGLASRSEIQLGDRSVIGGKTFDEDPFAAGTREIFFATEGEFFPVSLPSEGGRVAFVPINRGVAFFDRFSHTSESNTLSSTTWNQYSIGAMQCAMRLDITDAVSPDNPTPTSFRFSFMRNGVRENMNIPLAYGPVTGLPPGYIFAANENQSYDFGDAVVDLAYGANGSFAFQTAGTGLVTFNNARFGDPFVGTFKAGYYRPAYPFEVVQHPTGKMCVAVYPERFPAFLRAIGADNTAVNHSLVVNVDYPGSSNLVKPMIPATEMDYAVILEESKDLSAFERGFSLVTNLRVYFADDFNITPTTPPPGYEPEGLYFPPVSIFTPEQRYGLTHDPTVVKIGGSLGSLAGQDAAAPVRLLDAVTASGEVLGGDRVQVNLRPIRHPAEMPPITMMNWLILLQERRR